jgi:hypothetical protein
LAATAKSSNASSACGDGKASLGNARLIPGLNARFDVREPTRVNTAPPPGTTSKRYVRVASNGGKQGGPERDLPPFVIARPHPHRRRRWRFCRVRSPRTETQQPN